MNIVGFVFPLLVVALMAGYMLRSRAQRARAMEGFGLAAQGFFEQTGYRYPELALAPLERHVERAVQEARTPTAGNRIIRYVRSFHGVAVQFLQSYELRERVFSVSCQWSVPLARAPRIPFHVADRSLDSVGKAVREAFSSKRRVWSPRQPLRVQTGIARLDERFLVYAADPEAVRWLFAENPALVALLLQCAEVDLFVDQEAAVFADPEQKNVNAALGGMVGSMALGFDPSRRMSATIPVHDRVSEILARAVQASS